MQLLRKHLMRVYDSIALSYHSKRTRPWIPIIERAMLRLKPSLKITIVDVGCGSGHNTIEIARRGFYTIGLDISLSMINLGRRRFKKKRLTCYSDFIQADMLYLPFRDSSINSLVYIASIHHIPIGLCKRVLQEGYRCLKKLGLLVVTVWSLVQLRFFPSIIWGLICKIGKGFKGKSIGDVYVPWRYKGKVFYRYYHLYKPGELKHIIRGFNFKIVEYGRFDIRRSILPQNYYILAIKV